MKTIKSIFFLSILKISIIMIYTLNLIFINSKHILLQLYYKYWYYAAFPTTGKINNTKLTKRAEILLIFERCSTYKWTGNKLNYSSFIRLNQNIPILRCVVVYLTSRFMKHADNIVEQCRD